MSAAVPQTARYGAFISYNHTDAPFARRLHRRLESYRLPRRIVTARSAVRRLKPIFIDRAELRAASDITEEVRAAIADSGYLIVVCSPGAAVSEWVGREVRLFRELRAGAPILTALCRGEPNAAFHAELRHATDGADLTPLAADFRREGDGPRMALLKLVAALADVRLEDLVQRDAQRRIRQVTAIAVGTVIGVVAAGLLALEAVRERASAEAERGRGEKAVDYQITDLRKQLKSVGRLDVLNAVNQGALKYYQGQDLARLPVAEIQQRAKLLLNVGQDDERKGDFSAARTQFEEARQSTAALLAAKPKDPQRVFDQAQSEYWNGLIQWRLGNLAGAAAGYQAYSVLAHRLVNLAHDNADWEMEPGYADSNLGAFVLRQSVDTVRARTLFAEALADFQSAARLRPRDRDIQIQVADGWAWLGAVERCRGAFDRAYADWMMQRRMLLFLLNRDPRDVEVRTDLVSADLGLGRAAAAKGQFVRAIGWLNQGRASIRELTVNDPDDGYLAREARVLDLFKVRTWLMEPAHSRPSFAAISAVLGDCVAEGAKQSNKELTTFCDVLKARELTEGGRRAEAAKALAEVGLGALPSGPRLSERWLIDFQDEASKAGVIPQ